MEGKLRRVSEMRFHILGFFHAVMVLLRSTFSMHKRMVYVGLLDRVGLGGLAEKIFRVSAGYHPIAMVVVGECDRQAS